MPTTDDTRNDRANGGDRYVTPSEASRILNCSVDNVRRLARIGRLQIAMSTSLGRLFDREVVERERDRRQRAMVA
jgi:hypothetical protein